MKGVNITWPVLNKTAIAALQTLAGAGSLKLTTPFAYYLPQCTERVVSITSVNNLAGVNFTITGTKLGAQISEVLAGPNNGTVESVNVYDSITSITTSAAAAAVSVGYGSTGYFVFQLDHFVNPFSLQVTVIVNAVNINYTLQLTTDDIRTDSGTIVTFDPVTAMTAATTTQTATVSTPASFMYLLINTSDATGNLTLAFQQQGLV